MPNIPDNTFAAACYDQNSHAELVAALNEPADEDDCRTWGITPEQWRREIELALSHKRPPGRPQGTTKGRSARVEWSTTPERKERVRAMADAAGVTVAAWLDALVDRAKS